MPERATVAELTQVGVEAVPGTAVAATRKLLAMSFEPDPQADVQQFTPRGSKFMTVAALVKEWMGLRLTGQPTYTELVYALASVLSTPVITTPGGGVDSRLWTFAPASSATDAQKTLTIEQGDPNTRAIRMAYAVVNGLTLGFSRSGGVTMSGTAFARAMEDGFAMTAGLSAVELIPILATQYDVYVDATSGALGTTRLTRNFDAEFSIGNRYSPMWVANAAQPSYTAHVETKPEAMLAMHVEADAEGMAFLPRLRDGATRFIRLEAVGPLIEGVINYRARIDMAAKVVGIRDYGNDVDGVVATGWNWAIAHDDAWGRAFKVELTNKLTAL